MREKQAKEVLEMFVKLKGEGSLYRLFLTLHRVGIVITRDPDISVREYRVLTEAGLRYMAGNTTSIDISQSVQVYPFMQQRSWKQFAVDGSPVGLLFCLKYAADVAGVKYVKQCLQCQKIIFTTHGRQRFCENNEKCKNRFNYLRRKQEKENECKS